MAQRGGHATTGTARQKEKTRKLIPPQVSSYAKPGHRGRHNGAYWRNEPFWAWGLGIPSAMKSCGNSLDFAVLCGPPVAAL